MTTDFVRTRSLFHIPQGVIYMDGNSLGPLPVAAEKRVARVLVEEWGEQLIRGWTSAGWMVQPRCVGDRIGRLIGAGGRQRRHGRHAVDQGLPGAGLGA